jgi:hypothetical protein
MGAKRKQEGQAMPVELDRQAYAERNPASAM